MKRRSKFTRKDANHNEIVAEFERLGWIVLDLSQLKNACDIAATKYGHTWMIEIKDGAKQPSQRKLTEGEQKFKEKWQPQGKWALVETLKDVIDLDTTLEAWLMQEDSYL